MISGHGTDPKGEKMSKSLGNFVKAEDVIQRYGADALRWWACGTTLGMNVLYNEEDIRSGSKLLTKLWNVTRFVFMNCPKKVKKPKKLYPADQWMLAEAQELVKNTTNHLNNYEFGLAKIAIEKFFWTRLTDNYIELIKGRLYGDDKLGKQSAQFTIVYLLDLVNHLLAPYLPFITEEIYQTFFSHPEISIHLRSWPKINNEFDKKSLLKTGEKIITIIEAIRRYKADKGLRLIDPVASMVILGSKQIIKSLKPFEDDLRNVGKVGNIEWQESKNQNIKLNFPL
jgi:valyl-tRNA synthetase